MKDGVRSETEKIVEKVFVITGPTSSGKTRLGLELCKRMNGEIISADSRQVYKLMDIGTGKTYPDLKDVVQKGDKKWFVDGVNVWGYDLILPNEIYSAYDFAKFSLIKARDIAGRGKSVFLIGGTGFYIDVFCKRVSPSLIGPDLDFRKELESESLENLGKRLMSLNPKVYKEIDVKNKIRLIRAIERERGIQKVSTPLPYLSNAKFVFIGLTSSREYLYERANAWVEYVWQNGLLEETRKLLELGYAQTRSMRGIIYKTCVDYVRGKIGENEALERIKFDLHAYIRRQQTYLKKNPEIRWFDISAKDFSSDVYTYIMSPNE